MNNKKNYIHDDRSLCNGCNSYKFGEHQEFCVFNKSIEEMTDEEYLLKKLWESLERIKKSKQ